MSEVEKGKKDIILSKDLQKLLSIYAIKQLNFVQQYRLDIEWTFFGYFAIFRPTIS